MELTSCKRHDETLFATEAVLVVVDRSISYSEPDSYIPLTEYFSKAIVGA